MGRIAGRIQQNATIRPGRYANHVMGHRQKAKRIFNSNMNYTQTQAGGGVGAWAQRRTHIQPEKLYERTVDRSFLGIVSNPIISYKEKQKNLAVGRSQHCQCEQCVCHTHLRIAFDVCDQIDVKNFRHNDMAIQLKYLQQCNKYFVLRSKHMKHMQHYI